MARLRDHSLVGFVLGSLVSLACSAPPGAEDDGESVPDYLGAVPGAGLQPPGGNPGANPGVNNPGNNVPGVTPPSSEAVGNNGNVPIDGSNTGNNSGSNGTPTNPPPAGGAGGSAMTPPPSGGGIGGSSMQPGGSDPGQAGQGGGGNVPPGNGNPPPDEPPPENPPVGAGCGDGAIFCEDFDAIALGPITATVNGLRPERTVSIVEEAGRGRVLQVQAGTGYGNKSGVFLDNFTAPNNSHFGRAFIRVAQFPTTGGDHWVIVEANLNGGGENVRPVGGQFSRWAPGSDGPSAGDWTDWMQSNAATTAGAWECVEWQIDGANGANDMTLWVNGLEVQPIERGNFRLPTINRLWFGWVVYQTNQPPAYDVRMDDLVLSTERIGCD
jgi:hypothetical protein